MARGTQLQQLVYQLKAEVRQSTLVSSGVDDLPALKQLLARNQETVYDEFDWGQFRVKPYLTLAAGQRYYDIPAELDYERVEGVACWYNNLPSPVTRGIGFEELAAYNSDNDERNDPVRNWDIVDVSNVTQIEVWPLPASNSLSLQFMGYRKLRPLVSDSDPADLDDRMIVLYAAAELLEASDAKDAKSKRAMAQARFNRLKGRSRGGGGITRMAGAYPAPQANRGHITIVVR